MIIRIMAEGQYKLEGQPLVDLDRLDDTLLDAVEAGDGSLFQERLHQVLALVRGKGSRVPDTELVESDLIFPAADITLDEARELFVAYPQQLT